MLKHAHTRTLIACLAVVVLVLALIGVGFYAGYNFKDDRSRTNTASSTDTFSDYDYSSEVRFNPNLVYPLVPSYLQRNFTLRGIGKFYWIKEIRTDRTTVVYEDLATKPCDIIVLTKNVLVTKEPVDSSDLKFVFKKDVDPRKLITCSELSGTIDKLLVRAEPELYKQFKPTG